MLVPLLACRGCHAPQLLHRACFARGLLRAGLPHGLLEPFRCLIGCVPVLGVVFILEDVVQIVTRIVCLGVLVHVALLLQEGHVVHIELGVVIFVSPGHGHGVPQPARDVLYLLAQLEEPLRLVGREGVAQALPDALEMFALFLGLFGLGEPLDALVRLGRPRGGGARQGDATRSLGRRLDGVRQPRVVNLLRMFGTQAHKPAG